jgi:ketosteroid isomerase-like protein
MVRHSTFALAVSLVLLGCAAAPPAAQPARAGDDEAMVRLLEEKERLGVLNRDLDTLRQLWAETFFVNAPANQVSPDRQAVLNLFAQGVLHYAAFERRIERIRVDGDLAIVMGGESIQPAGNAPRAGQTVQRRFTHVWRRQAGEWRLVARHANDIARP